MSNITQPQLQPRRWWHPATVYQIYPASFKDTNGDGWDDTPSVIFKLPYIASLGVDAVWLSPCYRSPFHDMGYDTSDYRSGDPRLGKVKDVEKLIAGLLENGGDAAVDGSGGESHE